MGEVAIILSDVPEAVGDLADGPVPVALPSLARLGRFGERTVIAGWRAWLAGWLGRPDLAQLAGTAPAVVAAAAVCGLRQQGSVWLATPVHLTAGMRSVHMPPHGLLRLQGTAADELVRHFNASFEALGFTLRSLPGGGFLAQGPGQESFPVTTDPARLVGADLGGSTPQGPGAAPLLRLGAELEMWLHEHPLNAARLQAREHPISTLWLWGGGMVQRLMINAAAADSVVMGRDAFAAGLCTASAARYQDDVPDAGAILAMVAGQARVAALVPLFAPDAGAHPATVPGLLQRLDAQLLAPLLAALGKGRIGRLLLVANDSVTVLRAGDGLKFWRRPRGPLRVLQ